MKLHIGPGALVAAAFIGPGTVTACTLAGANFGYALIWALVFATVATIILQDMAARLGVGARLGLGEALVKATRPGPLRWAIGVLVFAALAIGNGAYEAGNLAGGALGLEAVLGKAAPDQRWAVLALAALAAGALWHGQYKLLERLLVGLVLIMSAAFALSFLVVRPSFTGLLGGLAPRVPEAGLLTTIALIGTTIVPYNLFLHAAAAREKWASASDIGAAQADTRTSIGLGGLVSILILATAAASLFRTGIEVRSAADMAVSIEPAFGAAARYLVGIGLLAAGLTSSITAPMATAYALSEMLGRDRTQQKTLFRVTALLVVLAGAGLSLLGLRPVSLILVAQYANGLLLPIIAVFLLYVMNQKSLLGRHVNGLKSNLAGGAVVAITVVLGARAILRAAGIWP